MGELRYETYLSADISLTDPKDDQLGYSSFAQNIAENIIKMSPSEGFVIAIYGQWGTGKSTLINFIIHHINKMPDDEQPILFRFNPWWFSGNEDLIRNFFSQLQIILKRKGFTAGDLAKLIADFSDIVAEVPIPYASSGKVLAKVVRPKIQGVTELKSKISESLKNSNKKILVLIDDIDRLSVEEIRQIFRLIKAVADFPNTIYLLSFDRRVVSSALNEKDAIVGENYLEKIIQLPLELPVPEKTSFRSMFFRKLDALLGEVAEVFLDQRYWSNLYLNGIDYLISTPRDINRLINTLSITYPIVKGEVNPYDFLAIEAIRITYPELYDSIRKQENMFIGTIDDYGIIAPKLDDHKEFHEKLASKIEERHKKCIKNILASLFPKLNKVYDTSNRTHGESDYRKKLRVCSPEIFPRYFRLAIPEGDISATEMNAIIALMETPNAFAERLEELSTQKLPDGSTRVHVFIERLGDYIDDRIGAEKAKYLINSLLDIGDKLIRPEDEFHSTSYRGFWDLPNDSLMKFRIMDLLRKLAKEERLETLKEALKGQAITMPIEVVMSLGKEYGKYDSTEVAPDGYQIISKNDLEILEDILLNRIRMAAVDGRLMESPHLPYVLYSWQQLVVDEKEIKEWVERTVSSDKGLIIILENFLTKSYTDLGIRYSFDPNNLKPYIEPVELIGRVNEISKEIDNLPEMQKTAIIEFQKGCKIGI